MSESNESSELTEGTLRAGARRELYRASAALCLRAQMANEHADDAAAMLTAAIEAFRTAEDAR